MIVPNSLKKQILKIDTLAAIYQWIRARYITTRANLIKIVKRYRLRRYGCEIVNSIHSQLTAANIQYVAAYGTLLGIIREKGFIRHDDDVDITLIAGTFAPANLLEIFNEKIGFCFSHAFRYHGQIAQMTFLYHKVEVDFFFGYRQGGEFVCPSYTIIKGVEYPLDNMWSPIILRHTGLADSEEVCVSGMRIMVPSNYEQILTECYGEWRVPNKSINWSAAKKTVVGKEREYPNDFAEIIHDKSAVLREGQEPRSTI